jgi:hypothetical protein
MYHTWFHAILFYVPVIEEMRKGRGGEENEEKRGVAVKYSCEKIENWSSQ